MTEELKIKLGRVRALMQEEKLDGIFLKRQDNFAWLTCGGRNYVGMGETGNCGLLVTVDKTYAITNDIESQRMKDEEHLEEMGFEVFSSVWHDTAFESNTLEKLVPSGLIGSDTGPLSNKIRLMRFDLTEAEIERYKKIGDDASLAMESAAMEIQVGQSEYEIAGNIMSKMEACGLEILSCMVAADERISLYRHPLPTGKKVKSRVQIGGNFRRNGLVICLTRYVYFEKPSDELIQQYRDTQLIDCTYMAASIPGHPYVEALEEGRALYKSLGYEREFNLHHQGGPIGYAGRDYRVGFDTPGVIADHQGFCWNPSITGTKSEDTIVRTKEGVIPITHPVLFPSVEIEVNGIKFLRPDLLVR